MARKKKHEIDDGLDDLDFSVDGSDPFDFDNQTDDRKPATKIRHGVTRGVKDTLKDPSVMGRVMKDAVPDGYRDTIDFGEDIASEAKDLYDTAAKELKGPAKKLRKKLGKSEKLRKVVPKKLGKRLDKWAEEDEGTGRKRDPREDQISTELGQIFQAQAEGQAAEKQAQEKRHDEEESLKEAVNQKRHENILRVEQRMASGIGRLVDYQDQIASKVQRKSLELQYRQYFTARDHLEDYRRVSKKHLAEMEAIRKNTALPDFTKMKNAEQAGYLMRERMIRSVQDSAMARSKDILKGVSGNIRRQAQDFLGGISGQIEMGMDQSEMMEDMGIDKTELAGQTMGSVAGEWLAKKGAGAARDQLDKSDRVGAKSRQLERTVGNLPRLMQDWAETETEQEGVRGFFIQGMKDLFPNLREGSALTDSPLDSAEEAAPFNVAARKSLVEVIPGFLSRIHNELQIIRTGDDTMDPVVYNYSRGTFTGRGQASKDLAERVLSPSNMQDHLEKTNKFIDKLDPNQELTEKARRTLAQQVMEDARQGRSFKPSKYANPETFTRGDPSVIDEITSVVERSQQGAGEGRAAGTVDYEKRMLEASNLFERIGKDSPFQREDAAKFIAAGQGDLLKDLDVVDQSTRGMNVNYERLHKMITGEHTDGRGSDEAPASPYRTPGMDPSGGGLGAVSPSSTARHSTTAGYRPGGQEQDLTQGDGKTGIDRLIEKVGGVEKAVRDTDVRKPADHSKETLDKILAVLLAGGGGGGAGGPADTSKIKGMLGKGWETSKNFFGKTMDFWGSSLQGIGSVVSGAGGGVGSILKGMGERVGGFVSGVGAQTNDLYVKGSKYPAILWQKLKEGEYYDSITGEPVASIKEILKNKNPIKDSDGNLVITPEDFSLGLYTQKGKNILRAGFDWLSGFYGKLATPIRSSLDFGMRVVKGTKDMISAIGDVYVPGEQTPRLLGVVLRRGGYYSQATGEPIFKIRDIDGPVVDEQGDVVVTLENLRMGLVDKNGKAIKDFSTKVKDLVTGTGRAVYGAAKKYITGAYDLAKKGVGKVAGMLGIGGGRGDTFETEDGDTVSSGGKIVYLLKQIRNILDTRMEKPEWERQGGWRQRLAQRGGDDDDEDSEEDFGIKGQLKKLGAAGALAGEGKAGEKGYRPGAAEGMLAGEAMERRRKKKGGGRKKGGQGRGKWGRVGQAAKWAASALGIRAAWHGVKGAAKGAATWTARRIGLAALMKAAGGVLGGIGATLSAPVTLTVGAVAVGGYLAYRYYTRHHAPIQDFRMAQYGIADPEDEEKTPKVIMLEKKLLEHVKYSDDGPAEFEELDDEKVAGIAGQFGVNMDNQDYAEAWRLWFEQRFKPVFLTHLSVLHHQLPDVGLHEVDDKGDAHKKWQYLTNVHFEDGEDSPYNVRHNPFNATRSLPTGRELPHRFYQKALEELESELGDDDKRTQDKTTITKEQIRQSKDKGSQDSSGGSDTPMQSSGKQFMTGIDLGDTGSRLHLDVSGGIPEEIRSAMNACTVVRLKAYGLKHLEIDKIRALQATEYEVLKNVTFNRDGSARFTGQPAIIMRRVRAYFNIPNNNSQLESYWLSWFNARFLPVVLSYVSAARRMDNQVELMGADRNLGDRHLFEVAMAITGAQGFFKGEDVSIWSIRQSPWPGYEINTDSSSVRNNLDKLLAMLPDVIQEDKEDARGNLRSKLEQEEKRKEREEATKQREQERSISPKEERNRQRFQRFRDRQPTDSLTGGDRAERRQYRGSKNYILPTEGRVSSDYGRRVHPVTGKTGGHGGIDVAAPRGTPIRAAEDGTIMRREYSDSYGNVIYIRHADGMQTRYAHMDRFQPGFSVGSEVKKGQVIGYVGSTGVSTGDHLHFEVRKGHEWDADTLNPFDALEGRVAKDAEDELKRTQRAVVNEEKVDKEDPMEGEDTIASTETGAGAKDKAPGLVEGGGAEKNGKRPGQNAQRSDAARRFAGFPSADPLDTMTHKASYARDTDVSQSKKIAEHRAATANEQGKKQSRAVRESFTKMNELMYESVRVQRSMDGQLRIMNKTLHGIKKNLTLDEGEVEPPQPSQEDVERIERGRRSKEVETKPSPVNLKRPGMA